ncbi:MAG: fibrobacter succinogenes major paralogous domain-containing protein [Bacteroidetes bacterium]|nr:fibrobacter succinogenes major paralogous domain-containing protein [Bacteroidota bacterium]
MKKFIALFFLSFSYLLLFSQAPQSFKYQAVARNTGGELLVNQTISVRISVLSGSPAGPVVYSEEHFPLTTDQGLFTLDIGNPDNIISGDFTTINWSTGTYFMQVELDVSGGSNYQIMGTTQLLSVPYALYAERAGIAEDEDWLIAGNNLLSNTSGNVGIGTANPTAKLHVGGNIITTGNLQVNDWIIKTDNDGIDWVNSNQKFYPENSQIFNLQGGDPLGTLLRFTNKADDYFGGVFGTMTMTGFTNVDDEFQVYTLHNNDPSYTGNLYFPNGAWSGDAPNHTGKIQYSSNQFYFNVGSDASRIATFRHLTQDVVKIENSGTAWFNGSGYFNGKLGVGTSNPDPSAALEVSSTTGGILFPRLSQTEIESIPNPVEGLFIYNTSLNTLFWYDGTTWMHHADGKSCGTAYYDGEFYSSIIIGTQCWMDRNLNAGIMIYGGGNQINNGVIEKFCYDDNLSNCTEYGGLYQWDEMMQYTTTEGTQGICPPGWHIPTKTEWETLINYLGGDAYAGGKMKEVGTTHWSSPNVGATNQSGFTGLPAGYEHFGSYSNVGYSIYLLSSTESTSDKAWSRRLEANTASVYPYAVSKPFGFSVRCLKDL